MFNENKDFFPTPNHLINKMLEGIDFEQVRSILEPSAGKGDIIEKVMDKLKYSHSYSYNKDIKWDIDTIELDPNLKMILTGKGYRVVHDDFLNYNTYKTYDAIIMNPPFSTGDKHLLHALKLMENNSGDIVCLLNAETIKNPYSNIRKELLNKLEQYNASIEYIQNAFTHSERFTNVETALIKIKIIKNTDNSHILDDLRQEESHRTEYTNNSNTLINGDFIKGVIEQYNFECKAGLKLIEEYEALKPYMLNSFNETGTNPILSLSLYSGDKDDNCNIANKYIKQLRMKYWKALFTSDQFMGLFTSNLKTQYYNKVSELRDYDFSLYNIAIIKIQLNNEMIKGVEDTIIALFDEFSHKHHYHEESGKNIHLFNGWKTNKAWKVNSKVIIPLNGFRDLQYSWGRYEPSNYNIVNKLSDIQKVFDYLDQGLSNNIDLKSALEQAEKTGETKKIVTKYFLLTFFKKGTCHIEFRNMELLHKFNLYAAKSKNWLPPSYSKAKYKDMSKEEKETIDNFEGETSYNKVMSNKDYYIVESNKLLMLA